jgi:hypothetical protein
MHWDSLKNAFACYQHSNYPTYLILYCFIKSKLSPIHLVCQQQEEKAVLCDFRKWVVIWHLHTFPARLVLSFYARVSYCLYFMEWADCRACVSLLSSSNLLLSPLFTASTSIYCDFLLLRYSCLTRCMGDDMRALFWVRLRGERKCCRIYRCFTFFQ